MSRGYHRSLNDILQAINQINQYAQGVNLDEFKSGQLLIDGVNMNLMIIGEAARNVPDEVQKKYPQVDWRNIVGLRNVITHEYFRLNLDRIWNIVEVELPLLQQQVTEILKKENSNGEE